jgi:hypothetical protein
MRSVADGWKRETMQLIDLHVRGLDLLSIGLVSRLYNGSLGYLLIPLRFLENNQEDSFDKGVDAETALSDVPDAPLTEGIAVAIPKPAIPAPWDFGSWEPEILDVIFIAIDFEYLQCAGQNGRIRLTELGISIFDTQDLRRESINPKEVVSTQHYRAVTNTKSILFGKTVDISEDEIVVILKSLLYFENESHREVRDLIVRI